MICIRRSRVCNCTSNCICSCFTIWTTTTTNIFSIIVWCYYRSGISNSWRKINLKRVISKTTIGIFYSNNITSCSKIWNTWPWTNLIIIFKPLISIACSTSSSCRSCWSIIIRTCICTITTYICWCCCNSYNS